MKRVVIYVGVVAVLLSVVLLAQGPATNALNLRVRTDASNYLITSGFAYTAPDGPATSLANIKLKTDANGYLITTSSPSSSTNFFYAANGASSGPSYSYSAATTSGMYNAGGGSTGFATGGVFEGSIGFGGTGFWQMPSNGAIGWSSGAVAAAPDTQLTRGGVGEITTSTVAFASLGTPANGTFTYCNDCAPTTAATCPATKASCVCAGSGTGALAVRLNGVWDCGTFQ